MNGARVSGASGRSIWLCVLVLAFSACSKSEGLQSTSGATLAQAELMQSPQGAFLAYEHEIEVRLAADEIPSRLGALQASCQQQKFGDCAVIEVRQSGGDYPGGALTVRTAPAGVEPLVGQAGDGAQITSRRSRAEDLAQAVADNEVQRARMDKEHARLSEFQQRPDISVSDLIALSRQLSEIEAQRERAQRESQQHRRRIDTQLLTIQLAPPKGQRARGEIAQAFDDFGSTLSTSIAWVIRAVAALLPVVVLLVFLALVWRRWRLRGLRR